MGQNLVDMLYFLNYFIVNQAAKLPWILGIAGCGIDHIAVISDQSILIGLNFSAAWVAQQVVVVRIHW